MVACKGNVNKFYTLFCLRKPKQVLGYVSLTLKKTGMASLKLILDRLIV